MNNVLTIDEMERARRHRDSAYEGLFFFAVKTTGIFCRPTCASRPPRRENIEYFTTAADAIAAGYRPCRRCRPLVPDAAPDWAAAILREIGRDPGLRITDDELKSRGLDPATVRRFFQRRFGVTFQQYLRSRRLSKGARRLLTDGDIDAAVFASGYDSHSGFREAFSRVLGDTPGRYRRRGECVSITWLTGPLGPLVAGAMDQGVCFLEFADRPRLERQLAALRRVAGIPLLAGPHDHLDVLEAELDRYFAGSLQSFSVPIALSGTAFQRRVWEQLRTIPYGQTRSYEELALALGSPRLARAVGRANGQNRLAIVVPCHRVVNKSGRLGGYGGGLRRKEFLLNLERASEFDDLKTTGRDR